MEEALVRAELVALPDARASSEVTIAIPRRDVETALAAEDGPMDLVLDVRMGDKDDAQPAELRKIAISWERDQLEHVLQRADGDVVTVVFDGEVLARLVDPDFELHGLRQGLAVLAVAVTVGTAAGVANATPTLDEGSTAGNAAAYTAIEQARGPVVTPDPAGGIEAARSAAATPAAAAAASGIEAVRSVEPLATAADTSLAASTIEAARSAEPIAATSETATTSAATGIEAVRSAEPLVTADAGSAATGIEAVRSAEPLVTADAGPASATAGIEAARSAEPLAVTSDAAAGIEGVRSAESAAVRTLTADDGISISMPSPQTIGFVGGLALLLTGAAFVTRGRRPIRPA